MEICLDGSNGCVGCKYLTHVACKHYLMSDALALLKEQETALVPTVQLDEPVQMPETTVAHT